jgi:survival of motor neuron-related-splicing factor 30
MAFSAGAVCEALSKGVWFPARVMSLTARDTYNVRYIGFGNTDELPAASLRAIERPSDDAQSLPPRDAIAVGLKCQAKYYVDAQYYTAQVTATTDDGFRVLFDGYGNSEEVPYEYLRPLATDAVAGSVATATEGPTHKPIAMTAAAQAAAATAAAAAAAASAALKPRDAVVAKAIKVPENLQVLPTDTEAEKERKRKRLKHIQKLNKQIEVDNAHNLKQHDWKSFQHKAVKGGKVKGSGVLSKRGTSMFASPDSVHGRVGVVGSGQAMTQYDQQAPKKLKKTHLGTAPRL